MAYNVCSTDNKYAATAKIILLNSAINPPTVNQNFLLINNATRSIPSKTAPPLIVKPIPNPRNIPPNIVAKNGSSVIWGNSNKFRNSL